ncbi:ALF repeat-containing protein [Streptomyces sp. EN16]|uniref:ALF repeat-containing protein n=1 Tax=Streptomyces sp. EN16 TaxID=212773 RepID=UPI00210A883F|nr:ALF repeat-containing protein [Streptomyces sp. EN16]
MSPSLWSRRRILSTVAGAAAVPALPSILTLSAAPAHAAPGDPQNGLPGTDQGKAVWAYKTGGRAVREGAAAALLGTPAALTAFLTTELPAARAEDNRFAVLSSLSEAAGPCSRPRARPCPAGTRRSPRS